MFNYLGGIACGIIGTLVVIAFLVYRAAKDMMW